MAEQDSIAPRAIMGLIAGALALFAIHVVMNPAPLGAVPAFIGGALGYFLMRTDTTAMVFLFSSAGAGIGVVLHRNSHLSGESTYFGVSLLEHLVVEGLIGWLIALGSLLVMGVVMRLLERR